VPRITDFCSCIYVLGCRLSVVILCDSDFGITPVDIITIGIIVLLFLPHSTYFIIIIIIIIEFLTSQLWLENIHLPLDVVINRIRIYIYCPSYTTQCCKVTIMQLAPKLHVSTPWGHLQDYKICVVQGTFVNAN